MTRPSLRRAIAAVLLAAAPAAILAATSGTTATAAASRTVVIQDIAFKPSALVVAKGTTVTWRWNDATTRHDVRSVGTRRFKSSTLKATGAYRVTFRTAGTYRYVCSVHFGMKGSVRVR